MVKFSIIIGSHGRKDHLIELIKSIRRLKEKDYELMVIDSSSSELDTKYQKLCDYYSYRPDLGPLCKKRNLAIKKAKGEIVIFTDDDCEVDKGFLRGYGRGFANSEISICTGKAIVHKDYRDELFDKCFQYDPGSKQKIYRKGLYVVPWKIGNGNNIGFRREVFDKIGLFDENFGPGTFVKTAEDADIICRALDAGMKIAYCPDIIVYHKVAKRDVSKDAYWYGFGGNHFIKKHASFKIYLLFVSTALVLTKKMIFASDLEERKVWRGFLRGWLKLQDEKN